MATTGLKTYMDGIANLRNLYLEAIVLVEQLEPDLCVTRQISSAERRLTRHKSAATHSENSAYDTNCKI